MFTQKILSGKGRLSVIRKAPTRLCQQQLVFSVIFNRTFCYLADQVLVSKSRSSCDCKLSLLVVGSQSTARLAKITLE